MSLKKMWSNMLTQMLRTILPSFADGEHRKTCENLSAELRELQNTLEDPDRVIKSKHDVRNVTMRTTVIAQKVELSTHTASISAEEKAYSDILDRFVDWIETYMKENLVSIHDMLFSEIIIYDTIYADSAVFLPKARAAAERALLAPQDYLNCDCCSQREEVRRVKPLSNYSLTKGAEHYTFNSTCDGTLVSIVSGVWYIYQYS